MIIMKCNINNFDYLLGYPSKTTYFSKKKSMAYTAVSWLFGMDIYS